MKDNAGAVKEFTRGVEVNASHGTVDWKDVAATGVAFGYVTVSRGLTEEEGQHIAANWQSMKEAGVLRGGYHYLRPLKDVESQARRFGEILAKLGGYELPPAVRLKAVGTQSGVNEWEVIPQGKRIELLLRWLEIVERAAGRKCVLATNVPFLQRHLGGFAALTDRDIWIADYRATGEPPAPQPWPQWTFWRYSESGTLPGVSAPVSLNYFNGARAELDRYASSAEGPAAVDQAASKASSAVVDDSGAAPSDTAAAVAPDSVDDVEKTPAPDSTEPSRVRSKKASKRD